MRAVVLFRLLPFPLSVLLSLLLLSCVLCVVLLCCCAAVLYFEQNEQVFDLLAFKEDNPVDLSVFEGRSGSTHVRGLTKPIVDGEEAAMNLLFEGETNRAIAEHQLNKASTRSHVVFTLYLERRVPTSSGGEDIVRSKLHLVDLAGSERTGKTGSEGNTFKEATYINKSLTFLEQVVVALVDKKRDHIPYRQTKLTNVLKVGKRRLRARPHPWLWRSILTRLRMHAAPHNRFVCGLAELNFD